MTLSEVAKIAKSLETGLVRAWRLRNDQKITECRAAYQAIIKKLKVTPELFQPEFLLKVEAQYLPVCADAFLLHLSLLRSDGKIQEALEGVENLALLFDRRRVPYPFQFFFQKGNNALYVGDFSAALELYVRATAVAKTNEDKVISLFNTLLCLENLGQVYESVLKELRVRIGKLPECEFTGLRNQFTALEQRNAFRTGDFSLILGNQPKATEGQEAHFRFWCSELPYHTFYQLLSREEKEAYFTGVSTLHRKSYRTRTLQSVIHAADFERQIRESDFADRLYLWTWRWLANPEQYPFEKVLILLENTEIRDIVPRLTAEDFCLIRNSLLWISFFVPRYAAELDRMARYVRPPGTGEYPLLEFERQLIEFLKAKQSKGADATGLLTKLKKHALWKSEGVRLMELVGEPDPVGFEPLKTLRQRITVLLEREASFRKGVIYVDLGRREITWDAGRQRVISDTMCLALDLMHRKECVTFEEFLGVCFGIHRFDSIIHNAKVYNLIARIKDIAGEKIEIKTKSGRIYCYGPWNEFEFQVPALGLEDVLRRSDLESVFKRGRPIAPQVSEFRPAVVMAGKSESQLMTRQELEAVIGKSRATANRIIQNWVEQGIVKKVGQARNTKYLVLSQNQQLPPEV